MSDQSIRFPLRKVLPWLAVGLLVVIDVGLIALTNYFRDSPRVSALVLASGLLVLITVFLFVMVTIASFRGRYFEVTSTGVTLKAGPFPGFESDWENVRWVGWVTFRKRRILGFVFHEIPERGYQRWNINVTSSGFGVHAGISTGQIKDLDEVASAIKRFAPMSVELDLGKPN